uniref:Uncharacterized protein n=1 Tax=Siphoviridae sp. ctFy320 TaxID=2826217 RepID=A0A8S5LWP2_9CAUD|nr:MAG TPA: hypothetical protein [Siphoviridae sp. ctFy320]
MTYVSASTCSETARPSHSCNGPQAAHRRS